MSTVQSVTGAAEAEAAASLLRSTHAIRERCGQLLRRAREGQSRWFTVDDGALPGAARDVADITRRRFPKLHVPLHSRWRHLEAGGVDRKAELERRVEHLPRATRIHALVDFTFASVLLDGGAGPDWRYTESGTGQAYTRSEGLAVASYHAFIAGVFSSDRNRPLQVDAAGLRALSTDRLASAFQVREDNPLLGLENRAILLRRFGEAMAEQPEVFNEEGRPSGLFDLILTPFGSTVPPRTAEDSAHDILSEILLTCSGIWPLGNAIGNVPLGDCWRHEAVRGEGASDGWVPFHKLSQWLTYSLLEPFEWAGVQLHGLDALTGLAEYRNGGLLLDTGVLRLRDEAVTQHVWQPGDELVVEWRALTVALLDELAVELRKLLHTDASHLGMGAVLEGGTWATGRELAQQRRGGLPPLQVASDGTVF
ncbi:URC4/urg3 family protein [Ramlibacter alkalitolerans]|uniref:URC4/urg3 family protein n=1 Tax=Ramlibacter alkalitolerans TaxID=2039631 RepID=A0ABS1JKS0_9BURK|nr:URC4/urg3 family protein [Ramlibacter alkalitolerans]MBL0424823.1 URC4/urg3 family protein [Ramlibacter alkalitolerans]